MTSMMSSDNECGRSSARNTPENVQGSAVRKATSHSTVWCLLPNTVVFLPEALTIHLDLKYKVVSLPGDGMRGPYQVLQAPGDKGSSGPSIVGVLKAWVWGRGGPHFVKLLGQLVHSLKLNNH